jgi:tetratricopeptide (TPR) repeat protein
MNLYLKPSTIELREKLEENLNEINNLKLMLNEIRSQRVQADLFKMTKIQNQINKQANKLISKIHKEQHDLLEQVKCIEKKLKKKYSTFKLDKEIEAKQIESRLNLNGMKNVDESKLTRLSNDFELIKPVLIEKINQFQIKEKGEGEEEEEDDDYELFLTNNNQSKNIIGQIKNNRSSSTTCSSLISSLSSFNNSVFVTATDNEDDNKSVGQKSDDIEELLLECSVLMHQKRYDDAIKYCNKIIELDKNNAIAYNIKCLCKYDDEIESIDLINKSIELDPNNSDYQLNKAHLLAYQKNYSKAIECYNKTILLNSNSSLAYIGIGKC